MKRRGYLWGIIPLRRSSQVNQTNLFAVLMGGKRRKPLVRRALVSLLYPVFFEESLLAATDLHDFSLTPIGRVVELEEGLSSQTSLYAFEVRPLITEYSVESESLQANTALYELALTSVVKPIEADAETLVAQTTVYGFSVIPLGVLYSEPSETLLASTTLYEFYIGST